MSKQREALQLALEAIKNPLRFGAVRLESICEEIREALAEPARKPLTDEDISAIVQSMAMYTWDAHMLARLVEKAHGIGEHP